MKRQRLFIAVSAVALLATACGGNAEEELLEQILENSEGVSDIDIDTGSGDGDFSITIEGEDGEGFTMTGSGDDENFEYTVEGEDGEVMTVGGGDIPDSLQIPVPDGGEVTMSLVSGDDVNVALQYPLSEFDRLVAFYDSTFDVDSESVDRNESTMSTEDGTFRNVFWSDSENYDWNVAVADCFTGAGDNPDAVCVTVYQTGGG